MKANHYSAIVLAAGFSSRMQFFKPLLPLGGKSIIDHLVETFLRNGVETIIVAGYHRNELQSGLQNHSIRIVENHNYTRGMFTSIQTGLRSLEADCRGVFIAPADIPMIRPYTIHKLLAAAEENKGTLIYPVFNKTRGHPPFIPARFFQFILSSPENSKLNSILNAFQNTVKEVPVPDSYILFDVDTPGDYGKLCELYPRYELPTEEECEVIINDIHRMEPHIYRHSFRVAAVAESLGQSLVKAGLRLDIRAIRAASILHDIAKGQPAHETVGANLIREMGFGKVADIISLHTDLPEDHGRLPLETKVVYLADKYVIEDRLVSLNKRYEAALENYGGDPDVRARIIHRMERAFSIKKEIEGLSGKPLEIEEIE